MSAPQFLPAADASVPLRVFSGSASPEGVAPNQPDSSWSLAAFFGRWYCPAMRADRRRRPPSPKTLERRGAAIAHWSRLMASESRPDGPWLGEIGHATLDLFRARLAEATYQRGPTGTVRRLSETSQIRTLQEVQIVLAAAGPAGRGPRAGILTDPPLVYVERVECFPGMHWSLEEARAIAAACESLPACLPRRGVSKEWPAEAWRALWRATLAFWFYSGHRATTAYQLEWSQLVEVEPGVWMLRIARSVKTRKSDQLRVHPRLLACFGVLRSLKLSDRYVIPWPLHYATLGEQHRLLQGLAGVTKRLPIKTWRGMHSEWLARAGLGAAEQLASESLGHSSRDVTRGSYFSARNLLIPAMPDLWPGVQWRCDDGAVHGNGMQSEGDPG